MGQRAFFDAVREKSDLGTDHAKKVSDHRTGEKERRFLPKNQEKSFGLIFFLC